MYLNCHSYYSLRHGTIAPEELIEWAIEHKVSQLALTDINNTSACLETIRLAKQHQIRVIPGVYFRMNQQQRFILLAKSTEGFANINAYLSDLLHQPQFTLPDTAPVLKDCFVIYPYTIGHQFDLKPHEYLGVSPTDLNRIQFSIWKDQQHKLVALQSMSFRHQKDFNTHRLLRAIDCNTLLSKLPTDQQSPKTHCLVSPEMFENMFSSMPHLTKQSHQLFDVCQPYFDFNISASNNQKTYTNNADLDFRLLQRLTQQGLSYRYHKPSQKVFDRIDKELATIKTMGFVSYFLINWRILKYARQKGYFYVGRGSGANSIVAYLLRITDVDPIELDLYFERFINLYRINPPDFDIDFSWTNRDDVTRFIFQRFKHVALIATYNTFQKRAAIRELGKVFGLPKSEIDRLSKGFYNPNDLDKLSRLVLLYSERLQGFPNYLGIHAGGVIIANRPIHYFAASFMPPKGFSTVQFDMVAAENAGLYKFDILSQRGLGKIKDTVSIVAQNQPEQDPIDIHDIARFKKDLKVKQLLKQANAIGCFYVESPAMRMLLRKLQVETYLDLVAASSVIRPGVASSGMMREYILRKREPNRRKKVSPILLDIMPDTFGVMVYQEDVIKVAHYFGGLTLGEADMLRRGMSGKYRSKNEFMTAKQQFFKNCESSGKDPHFTKEVWRQIESFAGYAFAKGHSASYAIESYQSLYLKAHYPIEYMTAVINNFGGYYSTELYVNEARLSGADVQAPCVNQSQWESSVQGKTLFIGFQFLHGLEHSTGKRLLNERLLNGCFLDFDDFIKRVVISLDQISILIKINAFRSINPNKRELLWEAHYKLSSEQRAHDLTDLFGIRPKSYKIPCLSTAMSENAFDEIELLGFPLCSPFNLLETPISKGLCAKDLPHYINQIVELTAYLIALKRTRTKNGDRMYFGTFLDCEGQFVDTVHFPLMVQKCPVIGRGVYAIKGKVVEEFDALVIEVTQLNQLPVIPDPRYSQAPKQLAS